MDQNRYIFVAGGDMQVNSREHHRTDFVFPRCHYHGLTISFDVEEAKEELLLFLETLEIRREGEERPYLPGERL